MNFFAIFPLLWLTAECSSILAGRKGIAKQDIVEGETLLLTCKADPDQIRTYRWVYIRDTPKPRVRVLSSGRRLVVAEPRFSIMAERNGEDVDIVLRLADIRPYEKGLFMCWKQNKKPHPQIYITVLEKAVIETEPNSVEITGPNYTSFGNPATIKCIIRPSFTGKVIWSKDGEDISELDHDYKQLISVSESEEVRASLQINIAREDANYTCRTDTDSLTVAIFHLLVKVSKVESLSTEPQKDEIHYGDSVKLTCIVSGTEDKILWMRDKSYIPSNDTKNEIIEESSILSNGSKQSELVVKSFDLKHNGQYVCYIPGDSKYVHINIEGRSPKMIGEISWVYLPGSVLQFSCDIQYTKGKKVVSWLFNEQELPMEWYYREVTREKHNNVTNFRLDISIVSGTLAQYIGMYSCSTPFANTSTSVYELVPLTIGRSPPDEIEVTEGESLSLHCSIFGYLSPMVYWEKLMDNQWKMVEETTAEGSLETVGIEIITKFLQFENNTMGEYQKLIVNNTEPKHSGQYQCKGTNERDTVMLATKVVVIALPVKIVGMTAEEITEGENLIITCTVENWEYPVHFIYGITIIDPENDTRYSIHINNNLIEGSNSANVKTFVLTITEATMEDQGFYECFAGNESSDSVIAIINTLPPHIFGMTAEEITEGENLIITCTVENWEQPVYFVNGITVFDPENETGYSIDINNNLIEGSNSTNVKTFVLTIPEATMEDQGIYACFAGNESSDSVIAIINTIPPEIMEIAASPAFEKSDLFISCTITNMPLDEEVIFNRGNENLNYSQESRYNVHIADVSGNNTDNILKGKADQVTYVLEVKNLRMTDSGIYNCMLGANYENISATIYIDVEEVGDNDDILLSISPSNNGKNLVLNCTVFTWNGEVTFFHNDTLILEEDARYELRRTVLDNGTSHTLQIASWAHNDAGRYQCFTTPFAYADINITSEEIAAMFPMYHAESSLEFGQLIELPTESSNPKLNLECLAPGEPQEILFTHNGIIFAQSDPMAGDFVHSRATLTHKKANNNLSGGFKLTIKEIGPEDLGYWHCTARYPESNVVLNSSLTVELYVPAKFTEVPDEIIKVIPGSSVALTCAASGLPTVQIDWFKKNISQPLQSGKEHAVLHLTNFSPLDEGFYLCQATNEYELLEYETILSLDKELRIIDMPPHEVIVEYGDDVDLTCIASGSSSPTVDWLKGTSQSPLMTGQDFTTLSIRNVTANDLDVYTCRAAILGSVVNNRTRLVLPMDSSVFLTTANAPTLLMGRLIHLSGPYDVEIGADFTLTCLVSPLLDLYVTVISYKEFMISVGENLVSNDRRMELSSGYGGMGERIYKLTVHSAQKKDSGFYECRVNTEPSTRNVHHVNVVLAGMLPQQVGSTDDVLLGSHFPTKEAFPTTVTESAFTVHTPSTFDSIFTNIVTPNLTDENIRYDDVIPVIIERISPIFASLGDTIKIPCSSTSLETPIIWFEEKRQRLLFVDELDVGQNPRFKLEESLKGELSTKTKSLVIKNLQLEDSGNYSCSIPHNDSTTASIEIIVMDLSEFIPSGSLNATENYDETEKVETITEGWDEIENVSLHTSLETDDKLDDRDTIDKGTEIEDHFEEIPEEETYDSGVGYEESKELYGEMDNGNEQDKEVNNQNEVQIHTSDHNLLLKNESERKEERTEFGELPDTIERGEYEENVPIEKFEIDIESEKDSNEEYVEGDRNMNSEYDIETDSGKHNEVGKHENEIIPDKYDTGNVALDKFEYHTVEIPTNELEYDTIGKKYQVVKEESSEYGEDKSESDRSESEEKEDNSEIDVDELEENSSNSDESDTDELEEDENHINSIYDKNDSDENEAPRNVKYENETEYSKNKTEDYERETENVEIGNEIWSEEHEVEYIHEKNENEVVHEVTENNLFVNLENDNKNEDHNISLTFGESVDNEISNVTEGKMSNVNANSDNIYNEYISVSKENIDQDINILSFEEDRTTFRTEIVNEDMLNSVETLKGIDINKTTMVSFEETTQPFTTQSTTESYSKNIINIDKPITEKFEISTETTSSSSYSTRPDIQLSTIMYQETSKASDDYGIIDYGEEYILKPIEIPVFVAIPGKDVIITEETEVLMSCPTDAVIEDITWKSEDKLLFLGTLDLAGVDGIQLTPEGQLRLLTGFLKNKDSVTYTCFIYDYDNYQDVEVVSYDVKLVTGDSKTSEIPFYGPNWSSTIVAPSSKYSSQILAELLQDKGIITRPVDISNCSLPNYIEGWENAQKVLKDCQIELNEFTSDQSVFILLDILATLPIGGKYATTLIYVNNKEEKISAHIYGSLSPVNTKRDLIDVQCGTAIYENNMEDRELKNICTDVIEKSISMLWESYKSKTKLLHK